ncbi:MAG: hypothetical protein QF578_14405 [Alphaproteobacteria bacterium]|nr:hypothetical protein [Alphaproteobacteria bacterium]MDP6812271.1 hypothetical protein [Alphaproteobacteria bacterium]
MAAASETSHGANEVLGAADDLLRQSSDLDAQAERFLGQIKAV